MQFQSTSCKRIKRHVSTQLNASVSGRRPRQAVKSKALKINSDTSLGYSPGNLSSLADGSTLEGIFGEQVEIKGLFETIGDPEGIISQVRNGSLEVIYGFFQVFNIFPGHSVLNALATSFFFLCLYIFIILVPKQ